jgi:magnesium-transporting ATPase (P-type)
MKASGIVAVLILIIAIGGFAYAYFNKVNSFNQTKSDLESLGFQISNNVSGIAVSAFIQPTTTVVPMVDFASFVSAAKQADATIIYVEGYSFYVILTILMVVSAFEYTPSNSIWWIW